MIINNLSLFSNAGIGEYGTNYLSFFLNNEEVNVKTVIANELLKERAAIYKDNYPHCSMVVGSIVDDTIKKELIDLIQEKKPITGTFSPPCQGSSGLNAFKGNPKDFRNQLVKSIFQLFKESELTQTLECGYIENVVSYYQEEIPCLLYTSFERPQHPELFHEYIINEYNEILNYKYFLIHKEKEVFSTLKKPFLLKSGEWCFAFNTFDELGCISFPEIVFKIKKIEPTFKLIASMPIKKYIQDSLESFGYKGKLENIRGEEYGAAQIRQRGFYIFSKSFECDITPLFLTSKQKNYNGKTIEDAFVALDLLKVYTPETYTKAIVQSQTIKIGNKEVLLSSLEKKNGINKVYVDTAISINDAKKELDLWKENEYLEEFIPNLHFKEPLKERFKLWIENTKDGSSAYKNKERNHRPYKLIEVKREKGIFTTKLNSTFVIKEDTKEFFKENYILDYKDGLTPDFLIKEDKQEWSEEGRQWMLRDIDGRKKLENKLIEMAKEKIERENLPYIYIFFPIKGFEQATYKRGWLNKPSNALTTKMGIGNSNTVHPIFNRVLTPAEVMALFGLGMIVDENGNYQKKKNYVPPKNIESIKSFQNIIYEICGEAIISIVAETVLKQLLLKYFKK